MDDLTKKGFQQRVGDLEHIGQKAQHTQYRCTRCEYFKSHLIRSGGHPTYWTYCERAATIPLENYVGRRISARGDSVTPDWCPVKEIN